MGEFVHFINLKPYVDEDNITMRQLRPHSQPFAGHVEEDGDPLEDDGKDERDPGWTTRGTPSDISPEFANAKLQARRKRRQQALPDYEPELQDLFNEETTEPATAPNPNLVSPDTPLPTRTDPGYNLTPDADLDVKPMKSAPRRERRLSQYPQGRPDSNLWRGREVRSVSLPRQGQRITPLTS